MPRIYRRRLTKAFSRAQVGAWVVIFVSSWVHTVALSQGMRLAAVASLRSRLAMADAIICQTAQVHAALLFTQKLS